MRAMLPIERDCSMKTGIDWWFATGFCLNVES